MPGNAVGASPSLAQAPKLDCIDIGAGERFERTLAWWLSACHVAVVLLSRDAMDSAWVRYELAVLVHRHEVANNVRLVPVFVGGAGLEDLACRPALEPLGLGALQFVDLADAEDGDWALERLVEEIGPPDAEPAFEGFVNAVHAVVEHAAVTRVAAARRSLAGSAGAERDPWFDDAELADAADGGSALRWALARELCAHGLADAYGALQGLARDKTVAGDVGQLVDVSLMATLDCAGIAALRTAAEGSGLAVVVGLTDAGLAQLAAEAVQPLHETALVLAYPIDVVLSGASTERNVDDIVAKVLEAVGEEDDDPEDFLADMPLAHPVFVLLLRAEGLNVPILEGLRERLPGVAFVVVSSATDPIAWSEELGGLPIAGAHLAGDAWSEFRDAEAALAACGSRTRKRLDRVLKRVYA